MMKKCFFVLCVLCSVCRAAELSETDAVRLLLRNNTRVLNASLDIRIASAERDIALSVFSPRIDFSVNRIFNKDGSGTAGEAVISKYFPSGTSVSAAGGTVSAENDFIDTENTAGMLMVRQSLLRNSFGRASRGIIRAADTGLAAAKLESEIIKEAMIIKAVRMYWEYVVSIELHKAQEERNRLYRELESLVKKKESEGAVEKREVLITKSALLQSRAALRQSEALKSRTGRGLSLLLSPEAQIDIVPVITAEELVKTDAEKLMNRAFISSLLNTRPDIRLLRENLKLIAIRSEIDSSNSLPGLDIFAGYGSDSFIRYGAAGESFSFLPAEDADYGYTAGIAFSYVLGRNEDAAKAHRDFLESLKLNNLLRLKQREAVSGYLNSLDRYRAALQTTALLKEVMETDRENAENERKELVRARTTFEQTVEYENRYISSRTAYWRAVADMRVAVALLRKSCGVLVSHYQSSTREESAWSGLWEGDFSE